MGRPPNRVRPSKEEVAFLTLVSMGVAGWSLVIELLITLEQKKILSDRKCRRLIEGASVGLKAMDDLSPHPGITVARSLLEGQIEGWMGVTSKKD